MPPRGRPKRLGPEFVGDASAHERRQWLQSFANCSLLDNAKNATVEHLIRQSRFQRFHRGELIIEEKEPARHVHFLLSGAVRVFQSDGAGGEYSPKVFCAPTHFGDLGALSGLARNGSSAEALNDAVTSAIDNQVIRDCLADDHGLCLAWLYSVARQHSVTIDSDRQNVFGGVIARAANVLVSLSEVFGLEERGLVAIDFVMSYANLARHIGCSRRGAIDVMNRLQRDGLVARAGESWRVDREGLRRRLLPGHLSLAHSFSGVEKDSK